MKRFRHITWILLFVLLVGCQLNFAQDFPAPEPRNRPSNIRSSPFAPPENTDRSFSTDKAPKLDTGCIFRSSGPIVFNIEVKRYLGPLNANGTLRDVQQLISNGLISREVELIMPAFDVDSGTTPPQGGQPELDKVSVNGFQVGFLRGQNNQWVLNSFKIPIDKIKFANKGINGGEPTGGINEIRIDIDTANTSEQWCTSIDWGAETFRAMSPVILIHGNGSAGAFFVRQGLTREFDEKGIVFDNSINTLPNPIAVNGRHLNALIPAIVTQLGAKNVHLVAHSKGGLDTREYLAKYQRTHENDFKILSLTTLSTPHNGSVLADLSIERSNAARNVGLLGRLKYEGFPDYTREMLAIDERINGIDNGRANLTTYFVLVYNEGNIPALDLGITFNTIAADADTNNNAQIDGNPDEFAGLKVENEFLRDHPVIGRFVVNNMYQILRRTRSVQVAYREECDVFGLICRRIAILTSVNNQTELGNDTLVTIPSGLGENSIQRITTNSRTFSGAEGRDHATIANQGVAQAVVPWLIQIDRTKGGLK